MSTAARRHFQSMLLILLAGCSGDPSGPSSGTLTVSIQGLPNGSAAAVSISGPGGYANSVTSSQTITGLPVGVYTVTASDVTIGTAPYQASPASQDVAVLQTGAPASALVTYSTPTGSLALTINGLGTGGNAAVTISGANGYSRLVNTSTTITGLLPGSYTIDAQSVAASCGSTFDPAPPNQSVAVTANTTASATVSYSPTASGLVNLCIGGMYVTQSAQNYGGTVPLVQGRDGLLRVFVVADQPNIAAPTVVVRFYDSGNSLLSSVPISPPVGLTGVPTAPDESSLGKSWNYVVDGSMIQLGLRIEAEVDPAPGAIAESNEDDNVFAPPAPSSRSVPTLNVTFVPVIQKGIPAARRVPGNVTSSNKDAFLETTVNMHPIALYNAVVHAGYTTLTSDTLQKDNANGAWTKILGEIDVLRSAEGSSRYYYGVVDVSYPSGVAGVAYVSNPATVPPQVARAALGWDDLPTGSIVAAHELGHNWARNHAPCGGPSGIDQNYPRPDGTTGGYGYDISTGTLEPPTSADIMGYCDPKWISEYTYRAVMDYLSPASPLLQDRSAGTVPQPSLIVWGRIGDGGLELEPAFQVNTRPNLPSRPGPYFLEARASDGASLFSFSFAPNEIADAPGSSRNFVFAVPLSSAAASRLASLHLSGNGRSAMLRSPAAALGGQGVNQADSPELRRVATGRLGLRWNSGAHPMIMVRDAETGEVLSLARGGSAELSTLKRQIDLIISDGVRSSVKRVVVTP